MEMGRKGQGSGSYLNEKTEPAVSLFRQSGERCVCRRELDNRAGLHPIKGKSCPCRCRDNLASSNRVLFVKGSGGIVRNKSRLLETAGFF